MQARDVMTLRIIVVKADASIMDAIRPCCRDQGHPHHSNAWTTNDRARAREAGVICYRSSQTITTSWWRSRRKGIVMVILRRPQRSSKRAGEHPAARSREPSDRRWPTAGPRPPGA